MFCQDMAPWQGNFIRWCLGCPCSLGTCLTSVCCFITTTSISEKHIYPHGIMSTAILFSHCRVPTKTPMDTRNSTGYLFLNHFFASRIHFTEGSTGFGDHAEIKPYKGSNEMRNLIIHRQPWHLSELFLQTSWLSVSRWTSPKPVPGSRNSHSIAV